jgi:hypothetical protein
MLAQGGNDMTHFRAPRDQDTGPRGGCLFASVSFSLVLIIIIAALAAHAADKPVQQRPRDGAIGRFGVYSDQYMHRRWARMCKGPARYDAMREANQEGKPNPCG